MEDLPALEALGTLGMVKTLKPAETTLPRSPPLQPVTTVEEPGRLRESSGRRRAPERMER